MADLTYQQMRLMELVATAAREQRTYLIAPVEADDAKVCAEAGLLDPVVDGSAHLTDEGCSYIIDLNKSI